VQERAADARRRGDVDALRLQTERAARWGYADLEARLQTHLAAVPLPEPPKPPSAEAVAYAARWKSAMALAAARRFDEALAELQGAAPGLPEAAADLELLREVKALHEAGLRALAARPAGSAVTLRVRSPEGEESDVSGVVRRAGTARLELEGGEPPGPLYVETSDLPSRAIVPPGSRAAAVAALLDGDAAATSDGVPEKYAAFAREAAPLRPRPTAAELDVRRRFLEAERAYVAADQRVEAAFKYRDLLRDHAEAALVRDERARIRARSEVPKEFFLPAAQMRSGGYFRFGAVEKAEAAWVCAELAPPEEASSHFIEIEFPALPETPLRLWVYVGGCCAETFTFGYQADELLQPLRKGDPAPALPGPGAAVPAAHGILFLKKTHGLHGGRREPKRWEWVALPLPKFAAAGLKKVRVVTSQQGFGVAAAVVSASRTSPPGDAETREQLRKAALPAKPIDPALANWWRLDDGQGRIAVDASGHGGHGTLIGAQWRRADGRAGLWFDGTDDGMSTPTSPLESVADSFTLAFWARPEADRTVTPEETSGATGTKEQRYVVFPAHGGDTGRAGLGVSVGRNGVSVFEHASEHMPSILVHEAPITGWTHVAVAVSKRQPRLFLNGNPVRTGLTSTRPVFPGGQVSTSEYGRYAGLVADLRIYRQALPDAEIRKVCGTPAPEAPR
jgi:hypothetical protein